MPRPDVSMNRRSRSPKGDSNSTVSRRSRFPHLDHHDDPSLSENADSDQIDQTLSNPKAVSEGIKDAINDHAGYLRRHLGLPESPGIPPPEQFTGPAPLFFIEVAPDSSRRGANCKLPGCSDLIRPGAYRLALNPSMDPGSRKLWEPGIR